MSGTFNTPQGSISGGGAEYSAEVISVPANASTLTLDRSKEVFINGTLTNANSFSIALGTQTVGKVNEYILILKVGATLPTLTHPVGVVWRGETPILFANETWTFAYQYIQVTAGPSWEIYGTAIKNV